MEKNSCLLSSPFKIVLPHTSESKIIVLYATAKSSERCLLDHFFFPLLNDKNSDKFNPPRVLRATRNVLSTRMSHEFDYVNIDNNDDGQCNTRVVNKTYNKFN